MFLPNADSFRLIPNAYSFRLIRRPVNVVATIPPLTTDQEQPKVNDPGKRNFLKVAGIAGAGIIASQILSPKKASAFIMGSSPTTGVVGVKDSTNARINPATEGTLGEVLKTGDLAFETGTGSLEVKVTSQPSGSSSFSNSVDTDTKGLVDSDRHVQVDVLGTPLSASTEDTLRTIAYGGVKLNLRLETVGAIDYVGEAAIGIATNAVGWRIKRINSADVAGKPSIIIGWAESTTGFTKVWDSRAGYTYSQ